MHRMIHNCCILFFRVTCRRVRAYPSLSKTYNRLLPRGARNRERHQRWRSCCVWKERKTRARWRTMWSARSIMGRGFCRAASCSQNVPVHNSPATTLYIMYISTFANPGAAQGAFGRHDALLHLTLASLTRTDMFLTNCLGRDSRLFP